MLGVFNLLDISWILVKSFWSGHSKVQTDSEILRLFWDSYCIFSLHQRQTGISSCQLFILNGAHFRPFCSDAKSRTHERLQNKVSEQKRNISTSLQTGLHKISLTHQLMHQACISLKPPNLKCLRWERWKSTLSVPSSLMGSGKRELLLK